MLKEMLLNYKKCRITPGCPGPSEDEDQLQPCDRSLQPVSQCCSVVIQDVLRSLFSQGGAVKLDAMEGCIPTN